MRTQTEKMLKTVAERTAARYDIFLQAGREAFADGSYDASYHALAAALHCAIDLKDAVRLAEMEALATEQMGHIDAVTPDYHHSTRSAQGRGNSSLLTNLAHQAHTHITMLELAVTTASMAK